MGRFSGGARIRGSWVGINATKLHVYTCRGILCRRFVEGLLPIAISRVCISTELVI